MGGELGGLWQSKEDSVGGQRALGMEKKGGWREFYERCSTGEKRKKAKGAGGVILVRIGRGKCIGVMISKKKKESGLKDRETIFTLKEGKRERA